MQFIVAKIRERLYYQAALLLLSFPWIYELGHIQADSLLQMILSTVSCPAIIKRIALLKSTGFNMVLAGSKMSRLTRCFKTKKETLSEQYSGTMAA